MTTNPSPEFGHAQKRYYEAQTSEEKLAALEEMISTMPQHKSAESLRANLRTRYKKLKESLAKSKKSGKGTRIAIKKESMQAMIVGFPNSGKSSVFKALTGVHIAISNYAFSTTKPEVGMMNYYNTNVQIIDSPAFPNEDKGIVNGTDTILLVVDSIDQIKSSETYLSKTKAKKIIVYNKIDLLTDQEKRKLIATLTSKKYNFILFSSITLENLEELKKKLFESFPIIRIYLKEPKKPATDKPMILKENSDAKEVAEKILKGFSQKVKKARVWGPSSKFPGQIVGLDHVLKDKDIIEFQTS
jgi:ribosome-interacting GTPase 1